MIRKKWKPVFAKPLGLSKDHVRYKNTGGNSLKPQSFSAAGAAVAGAGVGGAS
jgi:hypothetical protein